ncbi:hypothetical protein MN116_000704 [Schistosoma mekongi]|uniref:Elongator complex protein 4 n=1 Tax=Schistosoma mekongi TaxID=38744 RepID=A0AAE2D8W0_SCHME|nr:hypothetical protein MN116_000704 [Schistosoma mekongi]
MNGVKRSFKLSTFLISTGIPSFDELLGGGVASGSIILIEPDFHQTYAKQLLNLFVAEGILSGHSVFYGATETLDRLLRKLPDNITSVDEVNEETTDLKIAWRYQNVPNTKKLNQFTSNLGHHFNIMIPMDAAAQISKKNVSTSSFQPDSKKTLHTNLVSLIHKFIKFRSDTKVSSGIQRIVINSCGSPMWGNCKDTQQFYRSMLNFFATLHLLIQNSHSTVFVTLPAAKLPPGLFTRISHYCDYIFQVQGLSDQIQANPVYSEYDGLLTVYRIPWLVGGNTLEPAFKSTTLEWAFKIKRHQLIVQHLHLPPCLSDTVNRSNTSEAIFTTCSKSHDKKLDF